jgi:periplasmic protein TonB
MASNSTLAPNPLSSSWKGERYRLKPDQFAIATYDDNPSGPNLGIASPAAPRPQLRIDSWSATFLEDKTEQRSTAFSAREDDLFHESLVISGAKLRPLNPWAAVASVALLSLFLLALVVVPLLHTDVLPARERVTMLYMPSAGPVSNAIRLPAPPAAFRSAPTKITRTKLSIPAAVHTTQEAPSPAEVAASGLVGGVPGGVAGGIPGGVLASLVRDTASGPVLASTPPPATKRIRVPAPMAEANLVYDVAPKYPPEAGRARIEGTVVLMAVIGKDGTVRDVRVESGLPLLAQAAIDAVKQWRYRPYLLNGEPVEIDSQITINFNLSKG